MRSSPVLTATYPRARGGDPDKKLEIVAFVDLSPRTRGCSVHDPPAARPHGLIPAHAGVIPTHYEYIKGAAALSPRTRG